MSHNIHSFKIWPGRDAKNIDHIEFSAVELRRNPHAREDFPLPWDAGFTINETGYLVLDGGAGPGGFGSAEVCLRKDDYLRLGEEHENNRPFWIMVDMTFTQAAMCEQFGWEVTK